MAEETRVNMVTLLTEMNNISYAMKGAIELFGDKWKYEELEHLRSLLENLTKSLGEIDNLLDETQKKVMQ